MGGVAAVFVVLRYLGAKFLYLIVKVDQVQATQIDLRGDVEGVNKRLDRLNGAVSEQAERIATLEGQVEQINFNAGR